MKQEDKVPLREQCQKLVELGVVLDTEKYWSLEHLCSLRQAKQWQIDYGWMYYPAPDVAELGVVLPVVIKPFYFFRIVKNFSSEPYMVQYYEDDHDDYLCRISAKTEAQARCAALIWLIENKYLNIKDIKL